jgi:hypothetical protein
VCFGSVVEKNGEILNQINEIIGRASEFLTKSLFENKDM